MMGEARKRGAGAGPAKAGRPDGAVEGGERPQVHFRKSLRNPNINYRSGWWAVSIQVAKNKSIFGAIVGAYYGVPAEIRAKAETFLDVRLLETLHAFEREFCVAI